MKRLSGQILTPRGFISGDIDYATEGVHRGRILGIDGTPSSEVAVRDSRLPIILPGFIDLHVHGGGGRDIMEGGDAARQVARMHAHHGTTALLATTMTAPIADLELAFAALAPLCSSTETAGQGCARVLGVHLEGPYISSEKLGAQPDFARPLQFSELEQLNALAPIRVITLAPEIAVNLAAIEALCAAGYRIQIGHTQGTYEEGVASLGKGASGFTHLFNAMSGLHHRAPGMVGAALAHAQYAEIIPDLVHVHPGAIRVALRSIPCLYCVTDSTAAAGMPDGEYRLGRHTVNKCLGGVRLADGTLAGSTLTMIEALKNLTDVLGLELTEASRRVSTHAADFLGLSDRGRLETGGWADLVVLDRDLQLLDVVMEGVSIDHSHAG